MEQISEQFRQKSSKFINKPSISRVNLLNKSNVNLSLLKTLSGTQIIF